MTPLPGVWRRNLPKGWEWAKLNRVATLGTGHTPDRNRSEYWVDCDVPWVTAADLSTRPSAFEPLMDTAQKVSRLGLAHSAAVEHPADTVMFCRTASVGLFCITGRPMATTQAFVTWTPGRRLHPRYLLYVIAAMGPEFDRLAYGSTHLTIYMPDLESLRVPLPPLDVQRRIADFLDDQVGSMDRALELRRREVDLVETRRRAALTEIVFSDSVRSVSLGAVARVQLGRQRSPEHENGEFQMPYLRSANVTDGQILIQDVKSMNFEPAERRTFLLRVGDVLVTEGAGSPESVGASAVYRDEWHGAVCFQNTLVRLRPRGGVEAEYLGWWARAAHAAGAMRSYATGANILHIGVESLKRMPFPLRDERGQGRVMERCDSLDAGSQALHRALQASCDLLAERKRALITAAVTGEFDVSTASFRATDSAIIGVGGAE